MRSTLPLNVYYAGDVFVNVSAEICYMHQCGNLLYAPPPLFFFYFSFDCTFIQSVTSPDKLGRVYKVAFGKAVAFVCAFWRRFVDINSLLNACMFIFTSSLQRLHCSGGA